MREIEIRRHSLTRKGASRGKGSHLSAAGVCLAREVSMSMGAFDLVLASTAPRTLETALAMGFAVDELAAVPDHIEEPALAAIGHHERWSWESPWTRFAALTDEVEVVARLGAWLRETWLGALESVDDDGRVLVVSHGRLIEVGVVSCLPDASPTTLSGWGEPLHQCEGIRLSYAGRHFSDPHILRTRRRARDMVDCTFPPDQL